MKSTAAQCSKMVKGILKAAFPTTKFSVRSSYFANGNSVDITWNLGPVTKRVEELVNEFQYGHFDGMIDLYKMSNRRDNIPQAKFVSCHREHKSDEEIANDKLKWSNPQRQDLWKTEDTLFQIMLKDLAKVAGVEYIDENSTRTQSGSMYLSDLLHRVLSRSELLDGYHGIKRNEDITAGLEEEFYIIF